jgi:hypothetical protein
VNEDDNGLPPALARGERNSQLTVGYKGDRSYVVRGNNIGVFNHDSDNQVKYYATISKISTPKGKEFRPKEVVSLDIFCDDGHKLKCFTRSCYTIKTQK